MEPQTFQAREIKEALALVKRELGPDAIIVGTRRVPGRALGLLGGSLIEVSACASPSSRSEPQESPRATANTIPSGDLFGVASRKGGTEKYKARLAMGRAQRLQSPPSKKSVRQVISDQPDNALAAATGGTIGRLAPHAALRRRLLGALVPRDLCESLLSQISNSEIQERGHAETQLRQLLHDKIGAPVPLLAPGSRVIALAGPTGVGKTTTLAKLAANATLVEGKRIALVSLDDHRIGAIAQLRAYAELLDIPLRACGSQESLARTLASLREADLIFVDTPGVTSTDISGLEVLRQRFARAGEPISMHLCVSVSTRQEELDRVLHLYQHLSPMSIIATKLDEAVAVGSMLSARIQSNIPFSFITNGQQVPEDISPATSKLLLDTLLGEQSQ